MFQTTMKVSWDDCPIYYGKIRKVPNHQAVYHDLPSLSPQRYLRGVGDDLAITIPCVHGNCP